MGYNLLHSVTDECIFVLLYPDNTPVGLDEQSGGYPYKARYLSLVKYWSNEDEVRRYMNAFRKENFKLVRLTDVHAMDTVD